MNTPYIQKYLQYTARHESPDIFHIWDAVFTISHAVGRNVWIDMGYYNLYANHYIILVAASGGCRKGGAAGVARSLITEATSDREDRVFIAGKIYPEALLRIMNKTVDNPHASAHAPSKVHRAVTLFSPELGAFLGKDMQRTFMPDLLTACYECPATHDQITKNAGVDRLKDVCINLLGATTPTWMQDNMTPAIFGEGFIARTILAYAERPKGKFPREPITDAMKRVRAEMVMRLDEISHLQGEFEFGPGAGDFYDAWYIDRKPDTDVVMASGFFEREHDHVLKLAMVFAISAGTEPTIYTQHIQAAIKMLQQIRNTMPYALAGAQTDELQRPMYRVLETIQRHGDKGISLMMLGRMLFDHLDPETIQRCVAGLRINGMIESVQAEVNGKAVMLYKPYRGGSKNDREEKIIESGVDDENRA